jgi:hypothetical protein
MSRVVVLDIFGICPGPKRLNRVSEIRQAVQLMEDRETVLLNIGTIYFHSWRHILARSSRAASSGSV